MKNSKHLKFDEVVALLEKRWELLPETMDHISDCDQCSELIFEIQEMTSLIKSNSNISHIPDTQKIESIAEKSFTLLHEESEDYKKENSFSGIISFLNNWIKPVAIAGAAAVIAIVVYNSNSAENHDTEKIADSKKANIEKTMEGNKPEDKLFTEKGIKKAGVIFKSGIVKVETIKPTYFHLVSENEVIMKQGKAKFDVVPGNDFRINVNDSFIVRVLGTSFIIDFNNDDFSVKVYEGLVEVVNKSDNSVVSLTKNMKKTYKIKKKTDARIAKIKRIRPVKKLKRPKMNITPDASFLTQGREALKAGNKGAAVQLFIMELEKGNNKEKALYEAVRIYEQSGKHSDTINILKSNKSVVNSSKVYREELLIKGCMAQYRHKSSLSFCRDYLEKFPHGYRKDEIEAIVNE